MNFNNMDNHNADQNIWDEEPEIYSTARDSKRDRTDFIRKVYGIIASELTLSAIFVCFSVFSDSYKKFMIQNMWLFFVALVVNIMVMYSLVCYVSLARSVPTNYIL